MTSLHPPTTIISQRKRSGTPPRARSASQPLAPNLVFVYGSLKLGEFNNRLLLGSVRRTGFYQTAIAYPLVAIELPYLLHIPFAGHNVKGELWEVDDATLKRLDHLEGHPLLYRRIRTAINPLNRDDFLIAWVYFLAQEVRSFAGHTALRWWSNAGQSEPK